MVIRLALLVIGFFTFLSSHVVYGAASTWPAPISLFHKSPYLNAWIDTSSNVSTSPAQRWPFFFNRFKVFPQLSDSIRFSHNCVERRMVHGNSSRRYFLHNTRKRQQRQLHRHRRYSCDIYYTHTDPLHYCGRSCLGQSDISHSDRGGVNFLVSRGFRLKLLKLQDWRLHSFPFAYAVFDIASSDGSPHEVQVYTDTSIRECWSSIKWCLYDPYIFTLNQNLYLQTTQTSFHGTPALRPNRLSTWHNKEPCEI